MMRGIMDVFGVGSRHAQTPQPGATPEQASALAQSGLSPTQGNNTVPSATSISKSDGSVPAIPATAEGDKSPLANYAKLWEKSDSDLKPLDPTIKLDSDPAKIGAAARNVDYMKSVDPELLARATGGDMAAMMASMNSVAQTVMAHSTQVTAKIVEQALADQAKKYDSEIIPEIFRRNAVRTAVRADNPLYDNPALAPMLTMTESQLMQKFPNESPSQIRARATEYLDGFTRTVAEQRGWSVTDKPKVTPGTKETDWDKWIEQS